MPTGNKGDPQSRWGVGHLEPGWAPAGCGEGAGASTLHSGVTRHQIPGWGWVGGDCAPSASGGWRWGPWRPAGTQAGRDTGPSLAHCHPPLRRPLVPSGAGSLRTPPCPRTVRRLWAPGLAGAQLLQARSAGLENRGLIPGLSETRLKDAAVALSPGGGRPCPRARPSAKIRLPTTGPGRCWSCPCPCIFWPHSGKLGPGELKCSPLIQPYFRDSVAAERTFLRAQPQNERDPSLLLSFWGRILGWP